MNQEILKTNQIEEHPDLQGAINAYLEEEKRYFEKTYPGFVDVMFSGVVEMIQKNRNNGYLSNWKPGQDILSCITENIKKAFTNESGSIDIGNQINPNSFSPEIYQEVKLASEGTPGYFMVSMNDYKTVSTKDSSSETIKILSMGQGGCTNIVIAGSDQNGELLISVFHFSPIDNARLLDSIVKEMDGFQNCTLTKAIVFTMPGTEEDTLNSISNSIKDFPNSSIEYENTSKKLIKDAILIVTANKKNKNVDIQMKGQEFSWKM